MKKGDIVGRLSYNKDIIFVISDVKEDIAILQGLYVRLVADSKLDDLVLIDENHLTRKKESEKLYEKKIIDGCKKISGHITGKILHLDSDPFYLTRCLDLYKSLNIYAYGVELCENIMADYIVEYVNRVRPNIIVITGHDSYNQRGKEDLNNYKNTLNFMKAIVKIREKFSLDDICIYAGACGSNAEALIASGANFASSFDRKNIESLDPAIVAILAAITPFTQVIDINHLYNFSKMKKGSIGGVETYGKMRLLTC